MASSLSVTIPAGVTGKSAAFNLFGRRITHIIFPAGWITATSITFQGGSLSTNVADVYDNAGDEVEVTVAASHTVAIPPEVSDLLVGLNWLVIRSGTGGAAVNQTGAPVLQVITVAA